ncbi:MAG: multidrug effflux MFS transporter [Alphaproteobacteria bacterium]|nr:multidrug effflux MFS transporter [Alphaproteobacteria bacterium]
MVPRDLPAGGTKTGAGTAPVAPARTAPAAPPRTAPVWLLVGATALGPMALNIFVPAMPRLVDAFATDIATIGLTLSLYLVALGAGQLVCGPIADRWGRRPTLLGGLAVYAAAALLCAAASSVGMLIAARVIQAIGGCAAVVVVRAIIRDSYDRERGASVLAFVTMAMTIAPALSVTIGSYLVEHLDWRAGFVLVALCALVLLAAATRRLPETRPAREAGGGLAATIAAYRTVLRSPVFCGFALCLAFTSGAFFAFVAGAPFVVVQVFGYAETDYGLAFLMVPSGYMAGSFVAARCSIRVGVDGMVIVGTVIAFLSCVALVVFVTAGGLGLFSLFVGMGVIAVGNGISQPNATAAAIEVDPRVAGTASGLVGCAQMAIGGVATVAVALLADGTAAPMIAVMMGSTILAAFAYALAVLGRRRVVSAA